jgi:uncharacterized membrane protein
MMGFEGSGWSGEFWMLGGLLLLIGVIVLVVWAVSGVSRGAPPFQDSSRTAPNAILRHRFARGEISEEQFERARKILGPDR